METRPGQMSSESKWKRTICSTPPTSKTKISRLSPSDPKSVTRTNIIPVASLSLKSVWLYDWWLVKAEGGGLAVAGSASRDGLGERSFLSAAIVKRHSTNILEAKDGITVTLSGFINRERTCENGFSFQICERFHLGFPYCWEEFAQCCGEESADRCGPDGFVEPKASLGINTNSPSVSFDDLPVTTIRDLLMHTPGDSGDCALAHILEHFCTNVNKHSPITTNPNSKSKSPVAAANHMPDKTPKSNKSVKVDKKHKDADKIPHVADTVTGKCISPTKGVITRSMSRVNVGKMQEDISLNSVIACKKSRSHPEPVSSNTSLKIKNSASLSTSEGAKNLSGLRTPSSVLKGSPAIILSKGVIKAPDVSVVRRSSSRLKIRKDYSRMQI